MRTLAWATDVHLDFLQDEPGRSIRDEFLRPTADMDADAYIISGDISIAEMLPLHLEALSTLRRPVYFVLGNHDFYGGTFEATRGLAESMSSDFHNLHYLTRSKPISLTDRTAIVGHDGWYDGGFGQPYHSGILMSDWVRIQDFPLGGATRFMPNGGVEVDMTSVLRIARREADAAAEHVHAAADDAARGHEQVIIVTHVPPFVEAHVHGGKGSSPHSVPWYTSRAMGEALLSLAGQHPKTKFNVFCGHTHSPADVQVAPNMACHVGGARYGSPGFTSTVRVP